MWVAWAQHPNLPLRPKGESVSPDSAAAAPERTREMEAPDPGPDRRSYGKCGVEAEASSGQGRSEREVTLRNSLCHGLHTYMHT